MLCDGAVLTSIPVLPTHAGGTLSLRNYLETVISSYSMLQSCRENHSEWLLRSSICMEGTSKTPQKQVNLSAHDHIHPCLCVSGTTRTTRSTAKHISKLTLVVTKFLKFCSPFKLNNPTGIWRQGDFIVKNPKTKGFIIHGRRYALVLRLSREPLSLFLLAMAS